jgi:hypothetical protein
VLVSHEILFLTLFSSFLLSQAEDEAVSAIGEEGVVVVAVEVRLISTFRARFHLSNPSFASFL